jgi:hypothetical protein
MTEATFGAKAVARMLSESTGRKVSDRQVRAWVRDNVTEYDDDGYTHHAYTLTQVQAIVDGMLARRASDRSAAGVLGRDPETGKVLVLAAHGTAGDAETGDAPETAQESTDAPAPALEPSSAPESPVRVMGSGPVSTVPAGIVTAEAQGAKGRKS